LTDGGYLQRGGFASLFSFAVGLKMPEKIDRELVRKVAKLSRLELTEAEIEEFTGQLGAILEYMDKMNELDTTNVEPLAHCLPISNVLREDIVKESLGTEKTLANAPERDEDFFKVPKILDAGPGT
jgi:aspartyl-tRNA(Asn)/glutamyl-tRNA(Gln) amidotransferase subunit C